MQKASPGQRRRRAERPEPKPGARRADAHRQGAGPRRTVLAPRGRALDRRGPRLRQRRGAEEPGPRRVPERPHRGRRQSAARAGAAAAVALPQAQGPRHHPQRPAGPPDRVRRAAPAHAARHFHRPPRFQHRGAAAAHQRRRAGAASGAAGHRLAAALPRARARQRHAGGARQAQGRHRDRRHPLRPHRGHARQGAGRQRVALDRPARGQEPRGAHHPGDPGSRR